MTIQNRPHVTAPPKNHPLSPWLRSFYGAIYPTRHGKMDCTIEVTLTANAATTVVNDYRISAQTVPGFTALTLNAAAEIGNGTLYVSSRGNKTFTITHANNAQTDRTFGITLFG